ncbi:hypothetical protein DFR70_102211 [Nocardia tenerifensis]|uniref:Uncharacterized protein n=1 Tax=Nocardia tenerifensis TaxID=228006 RepID=A0A318KBX3_9NOCA|nr:hypothetical protein DFR70_102211 [Nocardia tenerifensis]
MRALPAQLPVACSAFGVAAIGRRAPADQSAPPNAAPSAAGLSPWPFIGRHRRPAGGNPPRGSGRPARRPAPPGSYAGPLAPLVRGPCSWRAWAFLVPRVLWGRSPHTPPGGLRPRTPFPVRLPEAAPSDPLPGAPTRGRHRALSRSPAPRPCHRPPPGSRADPVSASAPQHLPSTRWKVGSRWWTRSICIRCGWQLEVHVSLGGADKRPETAVRFAGSNRVEVGCPPSSGVRCFRRKRIHVSTRWCASAIWRRRNCGWSHGFRRRTQGPGAVAVEFQRRWRRWAQAVGPTVA